MRETTDRRHSRAREHASPPACLLAVFFFCGTALLGQFAPPAKAEALHLNADRVHLNPDKPSVDRVDALRFRGGIRLSSRDRRFGGISGLTFVTDDRLVAVSDRGWWISFRIVEQNGHLSEVVDGTIDPLRSASGTPLRRGSESDAEAVEKTFG
ncbi:MAG: esterase-like activity of phytase family protein, partial [Proteobacteria bacterium]|nr:esterase-like activity of phytase family protein [Pseudomonadota bacterium]